MQRDVQHQLQRWKESQRRKPLIVNGARQVGKTYALLAFGENAYKNTAYINFERDTKLAPLFADSLDPKRLIRLLSIHSDIEIEPGKTLIIFDEIQECPRALTSLKYFCEEASTYHVAAAGSLLGVKMANGSGFPVGKVDFLHLYPMHFFEFLSALGKQKLRGYLEEIDSFTPIPELFHGELIELLKCYTFVGGMPEVVAYYAEHRTIQGVREIQHSILETYERDFAKHAPKNQVMKITNIWEQISNELAKENKKFVLANIDKRARSKDYADAIQWLVDAGLIYKSLRIQHPKLPLKACADHRFFKLYFLDVGLLAAKSDLSPKVIIEGDRLFVEFKGALTENYVAQELITSGNRGLYYWASSGTAEVEFLVGYEQMIYPIEVKAGRSNKKKSLLEYGKKYSETKLSRTTLMNLRHDGNIRNYPLYMIARFPID